MTTVKNRRCQTPRGCWLGLLILALFLATASQTNGASPPSKGWELEREVEEPSYASIEPTKSNLNIDMLALTCVVTRTSSLLQLELYLSTEGPLVPGGVEPGQLRPDPQVMIAIDGQTFSATVFFADDHVLVANEVTDRVPSVSEALVDAIQNGREMAIRFDLVSKPFRRSAFDGEAVFDLRANKGGGAVASVRRYCLVPDMRRLSEMGGFHRRFRN